MDKYNTISDGRLMILIDGKPLDLNNLPDSVKILSGGCIEQTENGVKTTVKSD